MSHARRRRTLRSTVLAASLAVLSSFIVAPAAQAETTPADVTTEAGPTSTEPVPTDPGATDPAVTTEPAPTSAAPETGAVPSGPADAAPDPGSVVSGDTVVGELVQAWPDPTAQEHAHEDAGGHHDESPLSWIEPVEGDAVRVPTESLPDVAVGSTLAVTVGDEVVDEASAEQGFEPAVEVQAATVVDAATTDPTTASAGSAPTNTVTAVLVLPAGATADGMTISSVLGTLNGAVSSFWDEQSNGTVRIAAVQGASGWVRSSKDCANPYALWDDVAAQISWTGGAGKHLMLYVPSNASGCAYGLGTVGSSIGTGGRSYVQASALSVMAHELGHNFGLGHSSELQCNSSLESGTCQTRSYYDFYDVMGISWGQVGTLNSAQAARLGLLPAGEQLVLSQASASATITLAPASAATGVRTVKLTTSGGGAYYLEYRQASGQDSWLGDSRNAYRLDSGLVLRRAASGSDTSLLLDGTPSASSGWTSDLQQALPAEQTVVLAGGSFRVTAGIMNSTGIAVTISTSVPPTLTGPDAAYGRALYADMMGRPADDGGLAGWVSALGRTGDRRAVSRGFSDSLEYRMLTITQAYQQVLSRTPDQGGMTTWLDALATGRVRLDSLRLALMASQEFYLRGGGSDSAFVNNIYQAALGRAADASEVSYWSDVRRSSGASTVITAVWGSPEAAMRRVDQAYTYYLGRSAGRSEQEYWLPVVMGAGDERLREEVVVSYEYYLRSGGRFR